MPKDYKGEKTKPSMALIISVGPKMPKKPEDTATPDDKAMKKAWNFMKEAQDEMDMDKNKQSELRIQEQLRRQEEREKLRRQNASELTDSLFGSEGEFD
jgi:hypothetical protein